MENIYPLRMDIAPVGEETPFWLTHQYIHTEHGVCSNTDIAGQYAGRIFSELNISEHELLDTIETIKQQLISNDDFNAKDPVKQRCELAIRYWISKMQPGDVVFVRVEKQQVFLCEIIGYISVSFFRKFGYF